jgi:cytochrome c
VKHKPRNAALIAIAISIVAITAVNARAETPFGHATRGAQVFATCAACHSLARGQNMTGPSLAGVWGRKAGSLTSFARYSPALTASNVVWNARSLDAWLKAPARFIPRNYMTFAGIPDERQRADLIAYLKVASAGRVSAQSGGMTPQFQDLHKVGPSRQIRSIRICKDSYFVTTADGATRPFWEPNLRFETDSSDLGPSASPRSSCRPA